MQFYFAPAGFIVEEITPDGTRLEAGKTYSFPEPPASGGELPYTHFVLEKTNWNTSDALFALARACGTSRKRFEFAGTKDRRAHTTQRASAWKVPPERLLSVHVKDIRIGGAWRALDKVRLGELAGNGFVITLSERTCGKAYEGDWMGKWMAEPLARVPNFFGAQRFGSLRGNSAGMGKLLLQGKFEEAVWAYLTEVGTNEREEWKEARRKLAVERDAKAALAYVPRSMGFERRLLAHLALTPTDYVGALRKMPRMLVLLFLHAFQARLFNRMLETRLHEGELSVREGDWLCPFNGVGFPDVDAAWQVDRERMGDAQELVDEGRGVVAGRMVGADAVPSEDELRLLEGEGVRVEDFRMPAMPELECRGVVRPWVVPVKGFSLEKGGGETVARFELPAGSYATVAVEWMLAGGNVGALQMH